MTRINKLAIGVGIVLCVFLVVFTVTKIRWQTMMGDMVRQEAHRTAQDKAQSLDEAQSLTNRAMRILLEAREKPIGSGQITKAERFLKQALAIREKALGAEHPDTATSLENLAAVCRLEGKYVTAELLCNRALAIRKKILGPDHPEIARSLDNLADLYSRRPHNSVYEAELWWGFANANDDLDVAMFLYKRALAIREKALGAEHPDVARSLDNLVWVWVWVWAWKQDGGWEPGIDLDDLGKPLLTKPLLKRALAIREKALGAEHPETAKSLYELANLEENQAAAELLHKRALAIREKVLGAEHPDTVKSRKALARLYRE